MSKPNATTERKPKVITTEKLLPFDVDKLEPIFLEADKKRLEELRAAKEEYKSVFSTRITKWVFDSTGDETHRPSVRRRVDTLVIVAPVNMIVNQEHQELMAKKCAEACESLGVFQDDPRAIRAAYREIEANMAALSVDVEYSDSICRKCLSDALRFFTEALREVGSFATYRLNVGIETNGQIPDVLPGNLKDYKVEDGKFIKISPKVEIRKLVASKEQSKAIHELLESIVAATDKKQNDGTPAPKKPCKCGGKCKCKKGEKKECKCEKEGKECCCGDSKQNFTFEYCKKLVKKIEQIQPKIIHLIEAFCGDGDYDKINENIIFQDRLAKATDIDKIFAFYEGKTLDPDTNKEFPTFKIGLRR